MRIFFVILGIWMSGNVFAQTDTFGVRVIKDPRVDLLIKKQIQINETTTRESRKTAAGYRIQVANTNDRNQAIAIKTKIYQSFPELKAYLLYQAPYFRLRVGNFKTRAEAEVYQKKLGRQFPPSSLFIVNDTIEVKPEETETL